MDISYQNYISFVFIEQHYFTFLVKCFRQFMLISFQLFCSCNFSFLLKPMVYPLYEIVLIKMIRINVLALYFFIRLGLNHSIDFIAFITRLRNIINEYNYYLFVKF